MSSSARRLRAGGESDGSKWAELVDPARRHSPRSPPFPPSGRPRVVPSLRRRRRGSRREVAAWQVEHDALAWQLYVLGPAGGSEAEPVPAAGPGKSFNTTVVAPCDLAQDGPLESSVEAPAEAGLSGSAVTAG